MKTFRTMTAFSAVALASLIGIGVMLENKKALAQEVIYVPFMTCVAKWHDDYDSKLDMCAMFSTMDQCAEPTGANKYNQFHVYHDRACQPSMGGKCQGYNYSPTDNPDPTQNVAEDTYQVQCVWSGTGCVIDHSGDALNLKYVGTGVAKKGQNCSGTQDKNNGYEPPKYCPACS